jgi:hypothetical protein
VGATDSVTDSRTGTDGRRANGSGFDRVSTQLNHLLNPTASGWVGLSVRRVVGFGGRVCGGGMANGWEADKRIDDSESLNPLIR